MGKRQRSPTSPHTVAATTSTPRTRAPNTQAVGSTQTIRKTSGTVSWTVPVEGLTDGVLPVRVTATDSAGNAISSATDSAGSAISSVINSASSAVPTPVTKPISAALARRPVCVLTQLVPELS